MALNIQDLAIDSSAFGPHGEMADRYARDGDNLSPPLRITGVPADAVELAVICHDPDAPLPDGFTHWTLYGIPAEVTEIPEGGGSQFREGPSDFGESGYGGPAPPPGHGPHHYYFWVYALRAPVEGAPSRREFIDRHGDDVIEQNRTIGVYQR